MARHVRISFPFSLPFISVLLLFVAFFLEACGTTDPPLTGNPMTAVINGTPWKGIDGSAKRENGRLMIEGTSAIDITLKLNLYGDTAGTYQLGAVLNEGILIDGPSQWVAHGVHSGSVTVTAVDSLRVTGYFGFRAKDTTGTEQPKEIVNGTFDIAFEK